MQADNGDRVPMFKVEYLNVDDIRITNFTTFEVKNSKNYVNQNIDGVETSVPEPNTQLGNKYYMLAHGIATSTAADFFTLDDMLVDLDATAPELPEPSDERLIAKEDFSGTLDKGKWFLEPGSIDPSGKGAFTMTTVGESHSGIGYTSPLGTGSQPYSFAFDLQSAADGAGQYRTWITMRQGGIVNASLNENIALSLRNNKIGVQGTATGDWISSASEYELTGVNFSEMTRVIIEDYGIIIKVFAQKDGGEKIHILNLIMKPEGAKYAAGDAAQITLDWDTQVIYGAKAQNNKRPCLDSGYVYIWAHNGTSPAPVVDNIEIMKLDMPALVGPQIKNLGAASSTEGFAEATADEAGKKLQLHYNSEKRMDAVNASFTYDTSESAETVVVFIDKNQNGVCDDGEAIESGVQTEVILPAKLCFASQGITVTYKVTCVTNPLSDEQEKAMVQAIAGATAGTMEQALASVEEYLPEYGFFNDVYYKAIVAAGKQEMLYEQIIADRGGATTAAQIRDMILGAVGKTYVRSGLYQTEGMTAQQKVDAFTAVVSKLAASPYHLKIDLTKSMYNTLTVEDKANALTYLGLPGSKLNANGNINDAIKAASYMAAANTRSDDINVKAKYVQEIFKDMPYFGANDFDNWPVGGEKQVYMKDLFSETLGSNSYGDINDMMADMQAYEKKTNDHFKGNSNNGSGGNPVTPSRPNSDKDKDVSVSIPSGITDAGGGNKGGDITLTDLDAIAWAKDAVSLLLQRGIVSGYPDNTFRGENFVSRAEFVKMIVMAFDLYDSSLTTKQFADVGTDAWYNSYVASAVKAGVVTGITPSVFGADQTIRKEDMMVMIYRALNAMKVDLTPVRDNPTFADLADVSEYAINAVNIGYQTGLINGDDQNRFNPRSESNRATAAMMIYNAIVQIEGGNAK